MSVVPGTLKTDQQPPMTVPLRHFIVALSLLLLGLGVGALVALGHAPALATLAHVHLLLAGWVCLTIMGAMTQFVPVWSGVGLHSRRLARLQLWPVVLGIVGFSACFLLGILAWLPVFGGLMLVGFWLFVYNIGRTLHRVETLDITERHFALTLGFFLLVTVLGFLLAVDYVHPAFVDISVARQNVIAAHATLAVFGVVLTTVLGALYQLATMFTQTDLHGIDQPLRRFEVTAYPSGVVLLAIGRLLGLGMVGRVGGLLLTISLLAFSVILARRLIETQVDWTPMLRRYVIVALALAGWSVLTVGAWLRDPLAPAVRFGAPATLHLLFLGVIGFVVIGTLYHIVPFIIWVHRYSDRLGFEAVPMIDDLYDSRLARLDLGLFVTGGSLLVVGDIPAVPSPVDITASGLVFLGALVFVGNLGLTIERHSPHSLGALLFGVGETGESTPVADSDPTETPP